MVVGRCVETGSLGKLDIGALVFWKRLRANTPWAEHLLDKSESDVRKVTAEAVRCARDESLSVPEAAIQARQELADLPGFKTGDAVASALIVAAAPDRMAVYDKNAHAGLRKLGLELSDASGRYGRYMGLIEQLRDQRLGGGLASAVNIAALRAAKRRMQFCHDASAPANGRNE